MQVCKIMERNIFILKKGKNAFKTFFKKKKRYQNTKEYKKEKHGKMERKQL